MRRSLVAVLSGALGVAAAVACGEVLPVSAEERDSGVDGAGGVPGDAPDAPAATIDRVSPVDRCAEVGVHFASVVADTAVAQCDRAAGADPGAVLVGSSAMLLRVELDDAGARLLEDGLATHARVHLAAARSCDPGCFLTRAGAFDVHLGRDDWDETTATLCQRAPDAGWSAEHFSTLDFGEKLGGGMVAEGATSLSADLDLEIFRREAKRLGSSTGRITFVIRTPDGAFFHAHTKEEPLEAGSYSPFLELLCAPGTGRDG